MLSVIITDAGAFLLGISMISCSSQLQSFIMGVAVEGLWFVNQSRATSLDAHPLFEWGWQACRDTSRARDTCILWEQSRLDPRSLQISSREKYESLKVSCIFKKFSLIVYSLGYSFAVHTPKLGRRPCLSPSTSSAHTVCLQVPLACAWDRQRDPHKFSALFISGLSQMSELQTWIFPPLSALFPTMWTAHAVCVSWSTVLGATLVFNRKNLLRASYLSGTVPNAFSKLSH